jgi:uncharacterized protein (DUF169 family)
MGEMDYENRLRLKSHDFAVLDDFDFKYAPVGFKFFNVEGDLEGLGLQPLDGKMAWCQMLREAQDGKAFCAVAENHRCEPGLFLPGYRPIDPLAAGGRIGTAYDIFPDERANRRIYNHLSILAENSVYATGYAPVSKLTFEPDLLILACDNMDQGERILRATQWDTGDRISMQMTYVIGCNWIFTYPYVSGNINTIWTGICHGMTGYELYPPGLPVVSLPWDHIDRVLRNIREMPRKLPAHTEEREESHRRGEQRLGIEGLI